MAFKCFGRLPYELRLQIWEDAFDAAPGRVFHVKNQVPSRDGKVALGFRNANPSQVVATTCREAWMASKGYGVVLFDHDPQSKCRFRPHNDILFFDGEYAEGDSGEISTLQQFRFSPTDGLEKVETIGIGKWCPTATWELTRLFRALDQSFPSLKRIVYVASWKDQDCTSQQSNESNRRDRLLRTDVMDVLAPNDKVGFGSNSWPWQKVKDFLERNLERMVAQKGISALPTIEGIRRHPWEPTQRQIPIAEHAPIAVAASTDTSHEQSNEETSTSRSRRDSIAMRLVLRQRRRANSISLVRAF